MQGLGFLHHFEPENNYKKGVMTITMQNVRLTLINFLKQNFSDQNFTSDTFGSINPLRLVSLDIGRRGVFEVVAISFSLSDPGDS